MREHCEASAALVADHASTGGRTLDGTTVLVQLVRAWHRQDCARWLASSSSSCSDDSEARAAVNRAAAAKVQPCDVSRHNIVAQDDKLNACNAKSYFRVGVQAPRCALVFAFSLSFYRTVPTGYTKVQSVFRHGIAAGCAGRAPLARLSRHATSVAQIIPRPSPPAAVRVLAHIIPSLAPSRCCAAASASRGCCCAVCGPPRLSRRCPSRSLGVGHANVQVVLVVDGDGEEGRRCRCARRGVLARAAPPSPPPRCRLSCRCWRSSGAGWPGASGTWPGAPRSAAS